MSVGLLGAGDLLRFHSFTSCVTLSVCILAESVRVVIVYWKEEEVYPHLNPLPSRERRLPSFARNDRQGCSVRLLLAVRLRQASQPRARVRLHDLKRSHYSYAGDLR